MTKNEEKRAQKEQFKEQIREAMASKKVTAKDIALATGLKYHIVNDAIQKGASRRTDGIQKIADHLQMDVSWMPVSTINPPAGSPAPARAKVTKRAMNDGRYMVNTTGEKFERTEIMTEEEVAKMEGREKKATVEPVEELTVPTMTDESPELMLNEEEPCIWVDGKKYTKADIERLLEEGEALHQQYAELDSAFDEACSKIKELEAEMADYITKAQDLKDKYEDRDKEAIKWQVQANEYREQLAEIKAENANTMDLQNMTIGDAVKHYRALKRILKDEVLQ